MILNVFRFVNVDVGSHYYKHISVDEWSFTICCYAYVPLFVMLM